MERFTGSCAFMNPCLFIWVLSIHVYLDSGRRAEPFTNYVQETRCRKNTRLHVYCKKMDR